MQNRFIVSSVFLLLAAMSGHKVYAESKQPSLFSIKEKWKDQNGKDFVFSNLNGKMTVLAMVYTTCDYSCPLITQKMKSIHRKINKSAKQSTKFLLITFDPLRDTVEKLKEYGVSKKLDKSSFSLLTSTEQNTHALSVALNFQYKKMENGHFSHSNQITVLDKKGVIVLQQDIGKDLAKIVEVIQKGAKPI